MKDLKYRVLGKTTPQPNCGICDAKGRTLGSSCNIRIRAGCLFSGILYVETREQVLGPSQRKDVAPSYFMNFPTDEIIAQNLLIYDLHHGDSLFQLSQFPLVWEKLLVRLISPWQCGHLVHVHSHLPNRCEESARFQIA